MSDTKIEWAGKTWNPVTGCTKISAGCKNCYAERMTKRLQKMGQPKYGDGFDVVRCHESALGEPAKWKKPSLIFVCSMSDLFHEDVPHAFIFDVFVRMNAAKQHTFLVLTKRPENVLAMNKRVGGLYWPENVWLGVTVENQQTAWKLDILDKIPAKHRFVSCEPLLGSLDLKVDMLNHLLDWVIVGGESGPGARSWNLDWARNILVSCRMIGIPFFMKQLGGHPDKQDDPSRWPEDLRVREWPEGVSK